MKSFEQLVKEYYEPSPKQDVGSLVLEMVEQAMSNDDPAPIEKSEFQKALDIVEKEGYHYDTPRKNVIRIRDTKRIEVMEQDDQNVRAYGL